MDAVGNVVGAVLILVGVAGLIFGVFRQRRVRHLTSLTLWLTVSSLVLFVGLALQAFADGWDIQK